MNVFGGCGGGREHMVKCNFSVIFMCAIMLTNAKHRVGQGTFIVFNEWHSFGTEDDDGAQKKIRPKQMNTYV